MKKHKKNHITQSQGKGEFSGTLGRAMSIVKAAEVHRQAIKDAYEAEKLFVETASKRANKRTTSPESEEHNEGVENNKSLKQSRVINDRLSFLAKKVNKNN
jgi:hypothetical protein